jgi:hypothetical protein
VPRELFELGGEASPVAGALQDVELERARRGRRRITIGRAAERIERARNIPFARRVLGDAHRERRGDAAIGLADEAALRELGCERGVAGELGQPEP